MSNKEKRGIKRKRDVEVLTARKNVKKTVTTKESLQQKFNTKLFHGIKEVKKASKVAKTREIQRLVKRLKDTNQEGQAEAKKDIEGQLEVLKHLDHEGIAYNMLFRRLQKDKHFQENAEAKAAISKQLPRASSKTGNDSPVAVVEARLRSSKVLAAEIASQVNALRSLIVPEPRMSSEPDRDVEVQQAMDVDNEADDGWESGSIPDPEEEKIEVGRNHPKTGFALASSTTQRQLVRKSNSSATNSEASESGEDTNSGNEKQMPKTEAQLSKGLDEDTDEDENESEENIRSSSFLPSLSVGYIRGDSDASDWDDVDAEGKDAAPRKNRRGQRARKAIWEKKYGKNANHLKKEREMDLNATNTFGKPLHPNSKNRSFKHTSRFEGYRGSNIPDRLKQSKAAGSIDRKRVRTSSTPFTSNSRAKEDHSIHPSWEAAKRQKSQPMIVPSAGKKIVF